MIASIVSIAASSRTSAGILSGQLQSAGFHFFLPLSQTQLHLNLTSYPFGPHQ